MRPRLNSVDKHEDLNLCKYLFTKKINSIEQLLISILFQQPFHTARNQEGAQ